MITSSMNGMNTWVSTHIFLLAVFWLELGSCASWSKELYLITHRWQAVYTIRPQLSSVPVLKMIFRKVTATWEDRCGVGESSLYHWAPGVHQSTLKAHLPSVNLRTIPVSTPVWHKSMAALNYTLLLLHFYLGPRYYGFWGVLKRKNKSILSQNLNVEAEKTAVREILTC